MTEQFRDQPDLSARIRAALPEDALALLGKVAKAAEDLGTRAYMVGGSVRDALLGRNHYDLDVAIEGDAVALAQELERRGVGRVVARHRFGTAELDWNGPRHLDLVTARREWYEQPGALPTVEPGTILDDMARRDFTINAMAVEALPTEGIGQLLDPHGGAEDLQAGLVRVLHDGSFIDDPTRIARAVKYAGRLGFQIEPRTLELIFQAVRDGALFTVSLDRSVREVLLIMQEPRAGRMLADLEQYGVLRAIHPGLYWPYPADSPMVPAEDATISPEERRDTVLALLGSEYATEPGEATALARQLGLTADLARLLRDSARLANLWPALGEPGLTRSQVYSMLGELDVRALEAFSRIGPLSRDTTAWQNLSEYLRRLRFVRPELNGEYLKGLGVPPGPIYKELLGALLEAKLDGLVSSREDEERFIAEKLEEGNSAG